MTRKPSLRCLRSLCWQMPTPTPEAASLSAPEHVAEFPLELVFSPNDRLPTVRHPRRLSRRLRASPGFVHDRSMRRAGVKPPTGKWRSETAVGPADGRRQRRVGTLHGHRP